MKSWRAVGDHISGDFSCSRVHLGVLHACCGQQRNKLGFTGVSGVHKRFPAIHKGIHHDCGSTNSSAKEGSQETGMESYRGGSIPHLKLVFTSAPVLKHPVPIKPFMIEADTSEIGVGAILS